MNAVNAFKFSFVVSACWTTVFVEQKFKFRTEKSLNIKHERKHERVKFLIVHWQARFSACQKIDKNGLNFTCHRSTFRVLSLIQHSFGHYFQVERKKIIIFFASLQRWNFFVIMISRVLMTQAIYRLYNSLSNFGVCCDNFCCCFGCSIYRVIRIQSTFTCNREIEMAPERLTRIHLGEFWLRKFAVSERFHLPKPHARRKESM